MSLPLLDKFKNSVKVWWQKAEQFEKMLPPNSVFAEKQSQLVSRNYALREKIESLPFMKDVFESSNLNGLIVPVVIGATFVGSIAVIAREVRISTLQMEEQRVLMLAADNGEVKEAQKQLLQMKNDKPSFLGFATKVVEVSPFLIGGYIVIKILGVFDGDKNK